VLAVYRKKTARILIATAWQHHITAHSQMNIYLISQDTNNDYGFYRSAVVYAADKGEARNIYPGDGLPTNWADTSWPYLSQWVSSPDLVTVEHIGTASASRLQPGVICANYVES
jgi:hypothetical protein